MKNSVISLLMVIFSVQCIAGDTHEHPKQDNLGEDEFFVLNVDSCRNVFTTMWKSMFPQGKEHLYRCIFSGNYPYGCYKGAWGNYSRVTPGENHEDDTYCNDLHEKNKVYTEKISPLIPTEEGTYLEVNNPDQGKKARYHFSITPGEQKQEIKINPQTAVSHSDFKYPRYAQDLKKTLDILYPQSSMYEGFRANKSNYEGKSFTMPLSDTNKINVKSDGRYYFLAPKNKYNGREALCGYNSDHYEETKNLLNPHKNFICKKLSEIYTKRWHANKNQKNNDQELPKHEALISGTITDKELLYNNITFKNDKSYNEQHKKYRAENKLTISTSGKVECQRGNCDELIKIARARLSAEPYYANIFKKFLNQDQDKF